MGTKWVQIQYVGVLFWVQTQNLGTKKKNSETLKNLASPEPTFVKDGKFPLCS
jgi:hypothetical protein